MQTNILEYLEQTVTRVPDKVAFANDTMGITFRETYDQSRAVGSFLNAEGFYKQPVVVFMKKHPTTLVSFFGTIYSGNYYVPLDDEMPRHRIELIIKTLDPGILICDDTTRAIAEELCYPGKICHYDELAKGEINEAALSDVRAKQLDIDPIYIVFTSGSTGIPKGVMACHRSVIDYVEHLCDVLKFDETTVFGNKTPLYFDAYLKEVMPTLKYWQEEFHFDGFRFDGVTSMMYENHGMEALIPGPEGQKCIMSVIYDDIKANRPAEMDKFYFAAKDLREQGAEAIILGCTELSLVKRDHPIGAGYLDAMEVLARRCVIACGGKLKEEYQNLITK